LNIINQILVKLLKMPITITIPNINKDHVFWFNFRKAFFQVFLPILLALISFSDYVNQSGKSGSYAYNHLYFYTSFILLLYTGMKYILEYIFSVCSDNIVFRKKIDLEKTTNELVLPTNMSDNEQYFSVIIIKKIFKLRYSKMKFFEKVTRLCYFLGIDCPILIPDNVIRRLNNGCHVNAENEDIILYNTMNNIYDYQPTRREETIIEPSNIPEFEEFLVPTRVITKLDKTICDIKKELFNRETDVGEPNVI